MKRCLAVIAFVFAIDVSAQPEPPSNAADCKAQEATLTRDIDDARSRGQMLRRRQLAESLAALQTHCASLSSGATRAEQIERQEKEVRDLRQELQRAEEHLRKLKEGAP
ncbi:DUF1090 family protein [Variovorax sp. J22R133]|uniref:DUF1090 family protein n=1 Tax=Variovorax brevis TaxID=3053503 RepID=UPI002578DB95|nr:DUF1090 family protein [Variovorax sp. J22R133]MDM0111708.1 DUF1090 family protein [Variovorax sp. J22R133]